MRVSVNRNDLFGPNDTLHMSPCSLFSVLFQNANVLYFSFLQDNKTSTCQQCETFEEKKCAEFFETFEVFIKQLYAELKGKKRNS